MKKKTHFDRLIVPAYFCTIMRECCTDLPQIRRRQTDLFLHTAGIDKSLIPSCEKRR